MTIYLLCICPFPKAWNKLQLMSPAWLLVLPAAVLHQISRTAERGGLQGVTVIKAATLAWDEIAVLILGGSAVSWSQQLCTHYCVN